MRTLCVTLPNTSQLENLLLGQQSICLKLLGTSFHLLCCPTYLLEALEHKFHAIWRYFSCIIETRKEKLCQTLACTIHERPPSYSASNPSLTCIKGDPCLPVS